MPPLVVHFPQSILFAAARCQGIRYKSSINLFSTETEDVAAILTPVTHTSEQDSALDTPIPQVLHAIWAEALGLEEIGFDDDFLQLGGHSLLAMRITAEAGEAFDIDLPMAVLFRHPTLAAFTVAVEAEIREQELLALSDEQRG